MPDKYWRWDIARSHPLLARSHSHSTRPHTQPARSHLLSDRSHPIHTQLDLSHTKLDLIHSHLDLIHTQLDLIVSTNRASSYIGHSTSLLTYKDELPNQFLKINCAALILVSACLWAWLAGSKPGARLPRPARVWAVQVCPIIHNRKVVFKYLNTNQLGQVTKGGGCNS